MIFNVATNLRTVSWTLLRNLLIACAAAALGVAVGVLSFGSLQAVQGVLSFFALALLFYLIILKPINGLLLWIFFMPIVETYIKVDLGRGIPDLSFSRLAIVLMLLMMLLLAAQGRFQFRPLGWTDLLIVLVPLGIMASAPLSNDPISVLQQSISDYFTPVAIYFFCKQLIRSERDLRLVLWTLVLFGFVAASAALFEFFTGQAILIPAQRELTRFYRGDTGLRLIVSILGSTGSMGRVLSGLLPVAIYLALEARQSTVRILLLLIVAVISGGLLVTLSRTPILAALIAIFILQFAYPRFRQFFIVGGLVVALVLGTNWSRIQDTELAEDRLSDVDNFNGRTPRWTAGLNMWQVNPIRGWGADAYGEQSGNFRTDGRRDDFDAIESEYLHILVSSGLLGFVPYMLFLLLPLWMSVQLLRRARAPDWAGFITPRAIALYWSVLLTLLLAMATANTASNIVKLMPFVVAGAVIGSHEHWLRRNASGEYQSERTVPPVAQTAA